ncbi:MAG: hypothetical protein QM784_22130 [Polyangiaceae bacterium]
MTRSRDLPHLRKTLFGLFAAFLLQLPNEAEAASQGEATNKGARRPASKTIRFAHRDAELLTARQKVSSVMYLPRMDLASRVNPLLILLHGVNESRTLYPWFGGTHDLRPTFKGLAATSPRGFIVAAPTQTKNAWLASQMWHKFDVRAFVSDLRAALPEGQDVDPKAIFLAGHSAAGCNPKGGLAEVPEPTRELALAGVAFIDTCFETSVAQRLSTRQPELPIWILVADDDVATGSSAILGSAYACRRASADALRASTAQCQPTRGHHVFGCGDAHPRMATARPHRRAKPATRDEGYFRAYRA